MKKHIPVLLNDVTQVLQKNVERNGLIIDATLGRGGHFLELLKHFNNLIGLDADSDSINYVSGVLEELGFYKDGLSFKRNDKKVTLIRDNFVNLKSIVSAQITSAVLLDLGISMFHYKESKRGFSFLNLDEELDMRIDLTNNYVKAKDLLNALSEKDIAFLLRNLADEYNAKKYAKLIVTYRLRKKINTVNDLLSALRINTNRKYKIHPATKTFMALRIAVNSEHTNLQNILNQFLLEIKAGLIFLIITFHSLEERSVEKFCKDNLINFYNINPSNEEIIKNKSSRSSKLIVIKNV